MSNPKKNYIYNLIYQLLTLSIPLVTAPYLSRVIGVEGVGAYSYTYSIVHYFMIFTILGLNNYGNRSIAKVRNDKEKLSLTFWSIYLFQLLMGILMIISYCSYVFLFVKEYKTIALIEILFVISAMFDINWLFFGLEEFKKTITRNTVVKLGNLLLIFLFIKSSNDLWKYVLIMSGMTCISQFLLWGFLKGRIKCVKVTFNDIKRHIKPNLVLFIPVIAISLYKMMDKIMLGAISSVKEVGYYENAEKIINIPTTLISTLGTVMLPRMSNIVAKGEKEKISEYISKSIVFVMFLSFAMCMGLVSIGYNFAPLYFGDDFQKTGILIMLLASTLPFLAFANVIRTQYLIPNEKDKIFIVSVSLGAMMNFIMNIIFIPKYSSIGACIGTIAAEFTVMFYQVLAVRKNLKIKEYFKSIIPYFFKSLLMLIIVLPLNFINMNNVLRLIIQIALGCIIYSLLNIKYIFSIVNINKILKRREKI